MGSVRARGCGPGRHRDACRCLRASGLPRLAPLSKDEDLAAEARLVETICRMVLLAQETGAADRFFGAETEEPEPGPEEDPQLGLW